MAQVKSVSTGVDATGLDFTRFNEWDANNIATRASALTGSKRAQSYRDLIDARRPNQESRSSGFDSHHMTQPSRSYDNDRGRRLSSHLQHSYCEPSKCSSTRSELNSLRIQSTRSGNSRRGNRTHYRKASSFASIPIQYPDQITDCTPSRHIDALKLALSKIGRPQYHNPNRARLTQPLPDEELSAIKALSLEYVDAPGIIPENSSVEMTHVGADSCQSLANDLSQVSDNILSPFMTGIAFKKSRFGIFGRDQRRYLVLRHTCLEIYNDEASYTMGSARSCILLVGAKLELVDGNLIKIDSCGKQRQFGIESQDEVIQWVHGIHRIVSHSPTTQFLVQ